MTAAGSRYPHAFYNTRDLGGLRGLGAQVRRGWVWRGALHDDLLPCGLPVEVRMPAVFDLRGLRELPATSSDVAGRHSWPLHDPDWTREAKKDADYFIGSGLRLVPAAAVCVVAVLSTLAEGKRVFIGCRLGKDRTGLLVLLIGRLLGIEVTDLVADYVRSGVEYRNAPEWVAEYACRRGEEFSDVLQRLTPSAEIPEGILAALPAEPAALTTLLSIPAELVERARRRVMEPVDATVDRLAYRTPP